MGRLNWSPKSNWIESVGGLPEEIESVAVHIMETSGKPREHAIRAAVEWVKYICATGDVKNWPGIQKVSPPKRARACNAVAEWEAKKAAAHARKD